VWQREREKKGSESFRSFSLDVKEGEMTIDILPLRACGSSRPIPHELFQLSRRVVWSKWFSADSVGIFGLD
jgi:hypothetical protein